MLGKHLAVTSCDSGPLQLSDEEKSAAWNHRGGISYSPCIESLDMVPVHDLYDEWYVFKVPVDLGAIREGNIFEFPISPRHVEVFVNFGFAMDAPEMQDLVSRFWQQLEWIRPEAYIAESDYGFMTLEQFKNYCSRASTGRAALQRRVPADPSPPSRLQPAAPRLHK